MKIVVFATPQENPFPVRLEKGRPEPHDGMLLLLAGVGRRAAERLDAALDAHPAARVVIEFGGAAGVADAAVGDHHTVTRLFDTGGAVVGTLPAVPGLAPAAAVCGETIYRGEAFPWGAAAGMPLLYTMETAVLHAVCRRRGLSFHSIRLVTDDGRGDIRGRYEHTLAARRDATIEVLRLFGEAP